MSYFKRAVRGTAWVMLFHVAASFVSYINRIVLARNMTPSEYGVFYAVFTFVTFFLFFRELGLLQALSKHIPEFKIKEDYGAVKSAIFSTFAMQFVGSLLLSIFFFYSADYLAQHYFQAAEAVFYLKFLVIYVLASVVFRTMKAILQGFQSMFWFAFSEFLKNIVTLALTLLFFYLGFGVLTPLYAFVLVFPVLIVLYIAPTLRSFNFLNYKMTQFKSVSYRLFVFSTPVFLSSIANRVIGYIDTLILTYYRTSAEVGVYNVVLPTALILLFIGQGISSIMLPLASELWAKNDKKRLADGMRLIYRFVFLLAIPVISALFIYARLFIEKFFGAEYVSGAPALQILLVGVLFYTVAVIHENLISGIGKPQIITKIIIAAAIVNFVLNMILIPVWGIYGAAIATTISYIMMFVYTTIKTTRFIEMKLPFADWAKLTVPASVFFFIEYAGLFVLGISIFSTLLLTAVALAAYFYIAHLLHMYSIDEIKQFLSRA
ncbi:MAG TPA: flippase [Candidatus Nanoarchaeia archaeon]|nr:flippase [Candidatus Nanoarchaeia archaeon]